MEDCVEFKVKTEVKDVFNYLSCSIIYSKTIVITYILIFLSLLFNFFLPNLISGFYNETYTIASVGLLVSMPLFYYGIGMSIYWRDPRQKEFRTYFIDLEKIRVKAESFESSFVWDKMYGVSESKTGFYFWVVKRSAIIIPKRFLKVSDIEFLKQMKEIHKRK